MPLNQVSNVRPDPVLTALAVELGTGGPYIADQIAPPAIVSADTFKYATWVREDIKSDTKSKRAPGVTANAIQLAKTYTAGVVNYYALKMSIQDEIRNNDPSPSSLEQRRVKVLTSKLRLEVEARIAALLAAASNTVSAPSVKWDAASGVVIRKNILDARDTFRKNAGMYPNVAVIPPIVAKVVFNDSQILDLLKYTRGDLIQNGFITPFENMQIIVPGAIIDSSNPGASASIGDIFSADEVYYLYVDPGAGNDLTAQTALRQVRSTASTGAPWTALNWRDPDESTHQDWVSVEVNQVELTLSQQLILRQLDVLT